MGFTLDVSISAVTVFLQGLLSFFSPCVLPLLPLYIGYLSGGTAVKGEDGKIHYKQSKVLVHTLFFVAGVSFAFFLLGLGVSAVGGFFHSNQAMFARVGGVIAYLLFKITAMIHLAFLGVWLGVMLEVGLFIGVTFPVPDFGSSLLAFGGRTADELIISLIAHRLNRRTYYKDTEWEEEF